jgi:hypothetical protein
MNMEALVDLTMGPSRPVPMKDLRGIYPSGVASTGVPWDLVRRRAVITKSTPQKEVAETQGGPGICPGDSGPELSRKQHPGPPLLAGKIVQCSALRRVEHLAALGASEVVHRLSLPMQRRIRRHARCKPKVPLGPRSRCSGRKFGKMRPMYHGRCTDCLQCGMSLSSDPSLGSGGRRPLE